MDIAPVRDYFTGLQDRIVGELFTAYAERPGWLVEAAIPLAYLSRGGNLSPDRAAQLRTLFTKLAQQLAAEQIGADPVASEGIPADVEGGLLHTSYIYRTFATHRYYNQN